MIDALIVAQKSYVDGKADVTEETNNLRNAIDTLRDTVTSNKEKLTNKINDAKEIENNNYSIESWSRFEKALLEAIIVNKDSNATQEQVDKALKTLDDAIKGLKAPSDTSELETVIDKANKLDASKYTEKSWNVLQNAIDVGYKVLENKDATQEEINAAVDAINNAIDKLEVKSLNPDKPVEPERPMEPVKPTKPGVVTGDNTNFMAIGTLLVAATGIALLKKKKKEN